MISCLILHEDAINALSEGNMKLGVFSQSQPAAAIKEIILLLLSYYPLDPNLRLKPITGYMIDKYIIAKQKDSIP